ncbi:probable G-protein coupled receptor 139 [Stegostoma tigrinum]|uniref:probable G-protein coupled receptor 139 n=1 Tax=Stegostoma tigrinum TaxID=3053191 RepID=UPI002870A48E|nr:probable G-protein coupled receptor 139 [Stegostoma tigrinum]XP_059499611.1 probable G-protein coupled receptor 139 [Stegostoma tigrinum]XP_059499669.1 probable G-protein coupled receptor 139 [Stegostoma tigrinum]
MHGVPSGLVFIIYYPIIASVGIPANLVVILTLCHRRCGLSGCIIYYVVSMATADLFVMITAVLLNRIAGIYFPTSFLSITPVCSLRNAFNFAAIDSSAWLTVAFTFDRFVAICCQKLKIKYCTQKTAAWVVGTVSTLAFFKNIARYFVYEPTVVINDMPWYCGIKVIFYTSPVWVGYDLISSILTPCIPFILILLLNALTVRHIVAANGTRRRLWAQNSGENQSDPELVKRRKSIILLFAISGSFILLYALFFITILYVRITNATYTSGSNSSVSTYILNEVAFMLQFLSSCTNPFIYAGTQSKFRVELKNGMKYPLNLFVHFFASRK